MDGGAFLPVAMACAMTLVVCGGGLAAGVSSSSSSTGMGGGAFLGMGLISTPPPPQHACWMILVNGDDALSGGDLGCLLCGEGCRIDVGGNFAGTNGGGGALAAGCSVSPLPKEGAEVVPDDADVAVVTLGPDKVGVGDAVRVGVAVRDAYPLRALGDLPLPVLRPVPPRVTLVSATGGPPALMYCWYSAAVAHWVQLMPKTKALAAMMSPVDMDPSSMLEPAWRVTTSNLLAAWM